MAALDTVSVKKGATVAAATRSIGHASVGGLDFEIRRGVVPEDPEPWLLRIADAPRRRRR